MPFICIKAFYGLYMPLLATYSIECVFLYPTKLLSWPHSPLSLILISIKAHFFLLYDFSGPLSVLNLPFIFIIDLLCPLHALSWPRSLLNMSLLCIQRSLLPLMCLNLGCCIFLTYALKGLSYPLYAFSWERSLSYLPFIFIKALLSL